MIGGSKIKEIVVVGGGSAGWITALYAKKIYNAERVTVVQSSEIGVLGAGEGSTPHLIELLDYLEIPVSDLIQNTKATIKNGIKFTNWSNKNNFYYHGFYHDFISKNDKIYPEISKYDIGNVDVLDLIQYSQENDPIENDFISMLSEKNNVPFLLTEEENSFDPMFRFDQFSQFSIHFDARNFAKRLEEIGLSRGINIEDGIVKKINSENGLTIDSILLDSGVQLKTDFIFDCTGFARIFIGKHFNSEWISFSDSLPMKKAIPFFIDIDKENIPAYTESIAMEYGWMWKIPLQHRYGCGYVYDSNFISDEDAKKEIETFLGFVPNYPKVDPFLFNPGCYKEVLMGNCLAVGLSSAFVEPLEATSIFQTILLLKKFFNNRHHLFIKNKEYDRIFNENYLKETQDVVDFLYLHYMTNKKNNEFWENFTKNNVMPETLKEKMFFLNESFLTDEHAKSLFLSESFYVVTRGLELLNLKNLKDNIEINRMNLFNKNFEERKLIYKDISNKLIKHSNFLKIMGGLKE